MVMSLQPNNGHKCALVVDFDYTLMEGNSVLGMLKKVARSGRPAIRALTAAVFYLPAKFKVERSEEKASSPMITRLASVLSRNVPQCNFEIHTDEFAPNGYMVDLLKEVSKHGVELFIVSNAPTYSVETYARDLKREYGLEFAGVKGLKMVFEDGRAVGLDYGDPYTNLAATRSTAEAKHYAFAKIMGVYKLLGSVGDSRGDLISPELLDRVSSAYRLPGANGSEFRNLYAVDGKWQVEHNGTVDVIPKNETSRLAGALLGYQNDF
jgi:phosphoserine phosphatase